MQEVNLPLTDQDFFKDLEFHRQGQGHKVLKIQVSCF